MVIGESLRSFGGLVNGVDVWNSVWLLSDDSKRSGDIWQVSRSMRNCGSTSCEDSMTSMVSAAFDVDTGGVGGGGGLLLLLLRVFFAGVAVFFERRRF